jgi:hypothetical protein
MVTPRGDEFATCLRQVSRSRLLECAGLMGTAIKEEALIIPFFNRIYRITPEAIEDANGNSPTETVGTVLCRYILQFPFPLPPDGLKTTFRELLGAGPLVSNFTRNTNKLIASTFLNDIDTLIARSIVLNGEVHTDDDSWDVSVRFPALPKVPLFLKFNAADASFSAQSSLLFYQSAERYLDMQSLFALGTWVAGSLISEA